MKTFKVSYTIVFFNGNEEVGNLDIKGESKEDIEQYALQTVINYKNTNFSNPDLPDRRLRFRAIAITILKSAPTKKKRV